MRGRDGGGRGNFRPRDSMIRENGGTLRTMAGGVRLFIRPGDGNGSEVIVRPIDDEFAPAQQQLLRKARRLLLDNALARKMEISTEQLGKLKLLNFETAMRISSADQQRLQELSRAWQQAAAGAAKTAAEAKLIETLKTVGESGIAAAKQSMLRDIAQLKGILSATQFQQLQELGTKPAIKTGAGTRPTKATTRPAAP